MKKITTPCRGTNAPTGRTGQSAQTCPVCRRVLETTTSGRIPKHKGTNS